jgi:hypothetical protein
LTGHMTELAGLVGDNFYAKNNTCRLQGATVSTLAVPCVSTLCCAVEIPDDHGQYDVLKQELAGLQDALGVFLHPPASVREIESCASTLERLLPRIERACRTLFTGAYQSMSSQQVAGVLTGIQHADSLDGLIKGVRDAHRVLRGLFETVSDKERVREVSTAGFDKISMLRRAISQLVTGTSLPDEDVSYLKCAPAAAGR